MSVLSLRVDRHKSLSDFEWNTTGRMRRMLACAQSWRESCFSAPGCDGCEVSQFSLITQSEWGREHTRSVTANTVYFSVMELWHFICCHDKMSVHQLLAVFDFPLTCHWVLTSWSLSSLSLCPRSNYCNPQLKEKHLDDGLWLLRKLLNWTRNNLHPLGRSLLRVVDDFMRDEVNFLFACCCSWLSGRMEEPRCFLLFLTK